MTGKLADLASILRMAGLRVVEHDGLDRVTGRMIPWEGFGRGSNSGYVNGPTHVMVHHTASQTTPVNDVRYCNVTYQYRPITNLLIDRSGAVHVLAGGPTNTNGKGRDWWGGGVPDNRMNEYAISIELSNNGVGEVYPKAQQASVVDVAAALCRRYDIPVDHVRAHFEWTDRKIDPWGPSRWNDHQKTYWNMNRFRDDVRSILDPTPEPPEEDDVTTLMRWKHTDHPGQFLVGATQPQRITAGMVEHLRDLPLVEEDDDVKLKELLHVTGLTVDDLANPR